MLNILIENIKMFTDIFDYLSFILRFSRRKNFVILNENIFGRIMIIYKFLSTDL